MTRLDQTQELLLETALGPRDAALRAWTAVRPDLDLDAAAQGWFCVLPLVYRALAEAGVDEALLERLKGTYRSAWTRNQLALSDLRAAARALDGIEISPLLLGGAALATTYYAEVALRPLPHVELAVAPDQLASTAAALQRTGWTLTAPARHARPAVLRSPSATVCLVYTCAPPELAHVATAPASLGGVGVETLAPDAELFLACIRASRTATRLQGLIDAHMLAASAGPELDWDRLLEQAAAQRQTLPVREAILYLTSTVATPIAAERVARLMSLQPTGRERLAQRLTPTLAEFVRSTSEPLPGALLRLPRFLERTWELESVREVPLATLRRAGRRLVQ